MPVIGVVSGKGGVGKTTLSINLATVFASLGYKTLLVDANFTSPTVSINFGVLPEHNTLDSAISKGSFDPSEILWVHPSGFHFITPSLNLAAPDDSVYQGIFTVLGPFFEKYDITVLDGSAGVGRDVYFTVGNSDYVLLVANPNYPSLFNALKVHYLAKSLNKNVPGLVLNRVKGKKYEVPVKEAEAIVELPVIAVIPEDPAVEEALAAGVPLVLHAPNSKAAKAIKELAYSLVGRRPEKEEKKGKKDVGTMIREILEKIKDFLLS